VVAALFAARTAYAQPVRVTVECEDEGRTKACPAFLLGFVDAYPVLLQSPRAVADVVIYVNTTEIALVDRVHLRFVGTIGGAPPVIELDADLDSRADDDGQRAALEPAFLRGIALYVAARFPHLVTVRLAAPQDDDDVVENDTSPWDFALSLSGLGNHTEHYQTYNGSASLQFGRVETRDRIEKPLIARGSRKRQP